MILEKLRSRTKEVHRRLEENSVLSKITQPSFSLSDYIFLLEKFYAFIQPAEQLVFGMPELSEIVPEFERRRKAELLISDLRYLSGSKVVPAIRDSSISAVINSIPQALGYLYVLEGSTLGGKIISENLKNFLGIEKDSGGKYFNNYSEERGNMWKSFVGMLNSQNLNAEKEEELIVSSVNTFLKLEKWLRQEQ
jgi:heme oxygenase (biliverdin-IX-beta and delta-forming)